MRSGGGPTATRVAVALAVAVAAVLTAWAVTRSSPESWLGAGSAAGVEAVAPRAERWVRLLRGGLGRLAVPVELAVAAAALAAMAWHRRWRAAVVGCLVVVGAIGTVQAVKHGWVPLGPGVEAPVLSGHMPVVVAAATAVWLAVPARHRAAVAWWGAVAVLATGVGVVLTAWHTPAEVLASTALAVAWPLAVVPVARVSPDRRAAGDP